MSPRSDRYEDGYMLRREKRLRELYTLRELSLASAVLAVALTAAFVVVPRGGTIAFVVGALMLALWLVTILMLVVQRVEFAADKAIQREYELWNAQESEKPKRKMTVHLTDDGELQDDEESDELDYQRAARHLPRS